MRASSGENQRVAALPCANNCGFYGSPTFQNLCSKCFSDLMARQQQAQQRSQNASSQIKDEESNIASSSSHIEASHSLDVSQLSNNTQQGLTDPLCTIKDAHEGNVRPPVEDQASNSSPAKGFESNSLPPSSSSNLSIAGDMNSIHHNLQTSPTECPMENITSSLEEQTEPKAVDKPIQNRCYKCNKKVGLLGFLCRCGYSFCGQHRHADSHQCLFDYKAFGREQLSKANQRVVAEKLNRL